VVVKKSWKSFRPVFSSTNKRVSPVPVLSSFGGHLSASSTVLQRTSKRISRESRKKERKEKIDNQKKKKQKTKKRIQLQSGTLVFVELENLSIHAILIFVQQRGFATLIKIAWVGLSFHQCRGQSKIDFLINFDGIHIHIHIQNQLNFVTFTQTPNSTH
jgi:hypothetical protein